MRVVGMLPIRNEMGRYLDDVLGKLCDICDCVVAVDDASDDGTPEYVRANFPKVDLKVRKESSFNKEWALRAPLLERVLAKEPDWVIALDADEVLNDYGSVFLRRVLEAADGADGIAVQLYDMWGSDVYRSDQWWTAHRRFWTIAVRGSVLSRTSFEKRDHHCGRFPSLPAGSRVYQTSLIKIKHQG